jgi:hypothetical protein
MPHANTGIFVVVVDPPHLIYAISVLLMDPLGNFIVLRTKPQLFLIKIKKTDCNKD